MQKIIGLLVGLVAFVILVVLAGFPHSPPPTQAVVGELIIDQSVSGSSTLGIVTAQKLVDTASSTYFVDPAATGDSLVVAGAATASGNLTVGNTSAIRAAFGPLSLQYKSGLDAWTTGLTLQDSTGNVGIGTTGPTSNINGSNARNLDISGAGQVAVLLHDTASAQETSLLAATDGLYVDVAGQATATNNKIHFRTGQTNSSYAPTEVMTILNSGNVGIGTTGPGKTLSVNGTIESVTANAQILDGGGTSGQSATNAGGIEVFDEGIMTTNGQTIVWGPADPAQARAYMGSRLGGLWIIACYRDYWGSMSGWGTTWVYIFASGAWGGTTNSAALISSVGDTANCAVTLSGDTFTLTNNYPTGANVHYRATLYH